MTTDPQLPATRPSQPPAIIGHEADRQLARRQPIGVALLPLALITFVILAFIAAAWTFLAVAGG
jgi:hypothetical protein